ncbi:hypothetical protein K6H09_005350 [Candida tropicalis]
MFFNWLSSDKDDHQSIENATNIQSSQSGNDDTIENTTDLVELQNCSKITFGDDETNKDYHRIVNKTNDLNDLQNGANESIDDDDNNDNESTPIKEQESNQVEPTTSNYIKQLILSFFGLELISQCISITSENVDDVIKFIHNLTQLKLKSVQKDLKKYKVQRSKRNKAKRIWAQRKSDLELVRKLDEVIPRVVKYIEDGVAQSDDKTKEACEKYVKIANKSKNGNQ